jgi:hypothetical protein
MKQCSYCGKEYPDDVDVCPVDRTALRSADEPTVSGRSTVSVPIRDEISPEEKRFWERMTFRQFAILMIRLQALWIFFSSGMDLAYLPRYFVASTHVSSSGSLSIFGKTDLLILLFRILIRIAVAVLIIQKAEKILSWLVKDYVPSIQSQPKPDDTSLTN